MQTFLLAYAAPKAQVERSRQERLAPDEKVDMLRQQLAADVGLAWPPPRCTAGPGRPPRQSKWVQALYSRIEDLSLPPSVPQAVPRWWRGGSIIMTEEVALEHVLHEASQSSSEAASLEAIEDVGDAAQTDNEIPAAPEKKRRTSQPGT